MKNKKRVLIGYSFILHYRIGLFNKLAEIYDLTVVHSGKKIDVYNVKFKEIVVPVSQYGRLYFQPGLLSEIKRGDYDVIIIFLDVAWLTSLLSFFYKGKSKYIIWGPWKTQNKLANHVRKLFADISDSTILYSHRYLRDFVSMGTKPEKLYVAHNSIEVNCKVPAYINLTKDRLLFVGSLVKRKKNDSLIIAFSNIVKKIPSNINLVFLGNGPNLTELKDLAGKLNISERVIFKGEVLDEKMLEKEYLHAIASISVGQAGLSVLQSMGYGTPFITNRNAISGGEKYNIEHGVNGLICGDSVESIETNLLLVCNDIEYAKKLGKKAFEHYQTFCTIGNMAQGFVDAIEKTRFAKVYNDKWESNEK